MKKIFAIALALVMVLSMASAFALTCNTNYDWSCATTTYDCGKVKIEIVPFVRSNTACAGESDFAQNSCAAAIVGERVYYGIKLTVDADLNEEWYESVEKNGVTVTQKNLSNGQQEEKSYKVDLPSFTYASNDGKGGVYWHIANDTTAAAWNKDADFSNANVEAKWVLKSNVKVCAKLTGENEFTKAEVGGYTVELLNDGLHFTKDDRAAVVTLDKDDKVKTIEIWDKTGNNWAKTRTFVANNGTAFVDNNGDLYGYACNEGAFLKAVLDFFKFDFGTCMTKKAINKNFGWNDEIESCFTWSKEGASVVNPDCTIEIPKTGDVSVVAYAVMALVAAAGAMGLKK